jgi:hypothetical protein
MNTSDYRKHIFYIVAAIEMRDYVNHIVLYVGESKENESRPNKHFDGHHSWMYREHINLPTSTKKSEVERGFILSVKEICKEYGSRVTCVNKQENKDSKPFYIVNGNCSLSPLDVGDQLSTDSPWNNEKPSTLREFLNFTLKNTELKKTSRNLSLDLSFRTKQKSTLLPLGVKQKSTLLYL